MPPCALFTLDLDALAAATPEPVRYREVSRHPSVRRDLAVLLPREQAAGDVLAAIRGAAGPHLVDAAIFDRYEGRGVPEGHVSVAFRLVFQRPDRTLTDAEVARAYRTRRPHARRSLRRGAASGNGRGPASSGVIVGERTMTKAEIVEQIYERVGFSKKESAELVEKVFEMIKETLRDGEKVKISGFGNFVVREKNARKGRNPQTGEEILLEARRVLTFKPSLVLKNSSERRGRRRRPRGRRGRRRIASRLTKS